MRHIVSSGKIVDKEGTFLFVLELEQRKLHTIYFTGSRIL